MTSEGSDSDNVKGVTGQDWLPLGVLTAPWGLRGELKLHLAADLDLARRIKRIYVGRDRRPYDLAGVNRRGKAYTVKLAGIDSVEAAETLRGAEIGLPRAEAPPLPQGHYFVDQLIGLRVVTSGGRDVGRVADVLATGANDVYVVRGDSGEVLIPAIRDVVLEINPADGLIRIEPLPGLLD